MKCFVFYGSQAEPCRKEDHTLGGAKQRSRAVLVLVIFKTPVRTERENAVKSPFVVFVLGGGVNCNELQMLENDRCRLRS